MKSLTILFAALSLSSVAMAEPLCFQALNPEVITIKHHDANVSETARRAEAVLNDQEIETVDGLTTYPSLKIKIQSRSLRFSTVASRWGEDKSRFGVDCDGGQVTVQQVEGGLILNTDYLAGDVKSSLFGCSDGSVTFKNLNLEQVACRK